ncbi:MAG: M23 family peptidase, partial [Gammaproteobacteria bacterium]|nr:M23 family peptidase [Gammaproteobacteria bacterium]
MSENVPGGIVIIPLENKDPTPPIVTYNKQRVLVVSSNNQWQAIVGIPLATKPGKQRLKIKTRHGQKMSHQFTVRQKKYKTQSLKVEKGKVELSKENLERHWKEQNRLK